MSMSKKDKVAQLMREDRARLRWSIAQVQGLYAERYDGEVVHKTTIDDAKRCVRDEPVPETALEEPRGTLGATGTDGPVSSGLPVLDPT